MTSYQHNDPAFVSWMQGYTNATICDAKIRVMYAPLEPLKSFRKQGSNVVLVKTSQWGNFMEHATITKT